MKVFDIFFWQPPGPNWTEPHPCVIVSHPDRTARKDPVEVVIGSSQPPRRPPEQSEFVLDIEDGLDRATLVRCDLLYAVSREVFKLARGRVSPERRGAFARTLLAAHGWAEWF